MFKKLIHSLSMNENKKSLVVELCIRFFLGIIFLYLEYAEPFHRKIQAEELWLYKNPRTLSYVPTKVLWPFICTVPFFIVFIANLVNKKRFDGIQAFLALSLALGMNGVITNSVKLVIGRPRPDFFFRCYPDGKGDLDIPCTGNQEVITEGLKSFPSGHSSFAFVSMMFCTLYLFGKFQVFNLRGKGKSWPLLLSFSPLFAALLVALSRTCDYHHHWQDVLVGSILGVAIAWLCYFHYYPPLSHPNCNVPYSILMTLPKSDIGYSDDLIKYDGLESIQIKWI